LKRPFEDELAEADNHLESFQLKVPFYKVGTKIWVVKKFGQLKGRRVLLVMQAGHTDAGNYDAHRCKPSRSQEI